MNTLLLGALALATTSTNDATTASNNWTKLDREIESLAATLSAEGAAGASVTAYIKTAYRNSPDIQVGGNDEGGFTVDNARLVFSGKVGNYELKATIEAMGAAATVKDFYARWKLCEEVTAQIGNFKSPFLHTGVESDDAIIFYDRSTNGALWAAREPGVQLAGKHGQIQWWAAIQNGGDTQGDELLLCGKATFAFMGEPIAMKQTGGFGVDAPTRVQAGLGYLDDASATTGTATATAVEVIGTAGPFFGLLEMVDYDDGFTAGNLAAGNAKKAADADVAETTPWGITGGWMISEKGEVSLRYEDLDDDDDSTRIWAGYNCYLQGHALKWQLNWVSTQSDAGDVDELILGLTASI